MNFRRSVLGYRPRVAMQMGLLKTLAWYKRTHGKNIKLTIPRPTTRTTEEAN